MTKRRGKVKRSGTVQAVARALALLEALGDFHGEAGIVELAKRVGLHASTAHRLLGTLLAQGFVRQNPDTGRYALGARALHLAEAYLTKMDLRQIARPALEQLSRDTGETANLVILDAREALYLDKVEGPQSLRIFSRIGRRAPLYCTGAGKAILAYRPDTEVDGLVGKKPLAALTKNTITSTSLLRRELQRVRHQGFALDIEECEEGACCIAAPLRNVQGIVEAAISISGPSSRMTSERVEKLIPVVCAIAQRVSEQSGWLESPPGSIAQR